MESFPFRFGRYELIDLLATGGMAEVFRARVGGQEPTLAKLVAVKRILPSYSKNESFVRLFEKEIGLAASLSHPNLVRIYEAGVVRGQYYMAMEYVHGKTVDVLAAHCAENGVRIPTDFSCYVIREVCKVLAYAHNLKDKVSGKFVGIIHRDISPQNVIFSYEGQVKLFDFGVAKIMARDSSTVGSFQGKPAYMSPEQARGEDLDNRTDIFSIGVVLWELLTGQRLFYSEQPLLAIKNVTDKAVVPPSSVNPGVPKALDVVVLKALQRPLEARYQSAQQLAADLDRALNSLCPGYGEEQAAKFIGSAMGRLIERENADLYEKMHAEMGVARPAASGGIELEAVSPLSMQPEWRRAVADRAFNGGKKPPEPPPANRQSGFIRKDPLLEVPEPRSRTGLWAVLGLAVCAAGGWYGYKALTTFSTAVTHAVSAVDGSRNQPPPIASVAPQPAPAARAPASENPPPAPAPVTAAPQAQAPAVKPLDLHSDPVDTTPGGCNAHSTAVCAYANGEPTTFASSCAADAAKAVVLYDGQCNPAQDPAVNFRTMRLRDQQWRKTAANPRAAAFGDELEIDVERVNIPSSLRTQAALVGADGKAVKTRDMVATSTLISLGSDVPRGMYDVEVRVLDPQGKLLFANKANFPFFLGQTAEMKRSFGQ